jgi:hypothetical protein
VSQSPQPADFSGNWIEVEHGRRALALAARSFYGKPDERIQVTGITGTNGKTTTSYLLASIFEAAGVRFNQVEDLRAGKAVYHDFTNALLIERGERPSILTRGYARLRPESAGTAWRIIEKKQNR